MLNGILVIDKDAGMTSSDVVYHLRHCLHIRKMGHAGTLDPEVTGVLPIAIGQATKLIELMHQKPKSYQGTGLFGYATDSYDATGKVLVQKKLIQPFTPEEIQKGMDSFLGETIQVPPIYSAVKVQGKHLYDYARAGIPVKRPRRRVNILKYNLVKTPQFDPAQGQQSFNFDITCSKGTYVRSLINDLGNKLGCPAVMIRLRRTASSGFGLQQTVKLAEIEANPAQAANFIQPLETFFRDLPGYNLTDQEWQRVKNGAAINIESPAKKLALRYNKRVKAIYRANGKNYIPDLMLLANE